MHDGGALFPRGRVSLEKLMRKLVLGVVAAATLFGGSVAATASQAQTQPAIVFGTDSLDQSAALERVQYFYGGRRYCWYAGGWHGPGYYWCGYAWRRGFGWGGGWGWHGWRWGGWHHGWGGGWHHGWHGGWHGHHGWHH